MSKISKLLFFFVSILLVPPIGRCQSLNYVHYDVQEGLAGSTVYEICQDASGFLWFATDNGLSRYDGSVFKNFTVQDGLPDNEVLKIFADSRGRVWIGTFSKNLTYYENGKFINGTSDSILNNPVLNFQPLYFLEDLDGNIVITDYKKVALITPDNKVIDFTGLPEFDNHPYRAIAINSYYYGKGFLLRLNDTTFHYRDGKLFFYDLDKPRPGTNKIFPHYFKSRQDTSSNRIEIDLPADIISATLHNGAPIFENTINGAWLFDTVHNKLSQHFLSGKKISRTILDNEQNIWFATLGEGVYKLASTQMRTIEFAEEHNRLNNEVFSIVPYKNEVLAGLGSSRVAILKEGRLAKINSYLAQTERLTNSNTTNRLYCSYTDQPNRVFLGFDAYLAKIENGQTLFSPTLASKSIENFDDDHILVGTFAYALKVRKSDLKPVDTIWNGRCTEVYYDHNRFLVGTMDGLYAVDNLKQSKYLGELHPALKRRISDIKMDTRGNLFIATIDMGLVVLHNDRVSYWLNDESGISSNNCKGMFIDSNFIWLATSRGVNKIDLNNYGKIITYGASDGLPSDNINAIYVHDSIIWLGSPEGLTYFNEATVSSTSECKLHLEVHTAGTRINEALYKLSFTSPQISFDFVGISYRSGGDVVYNYRLLGLDSSWMQTRQNTLNFPALSSGNYVFELYAVNKFGVKSDVKQISFSVSRSFWKSWPFYLLIVVLTILITAWIVNSRNKVLKHRLLENQRFHEQVADLEQQALQAQMNPQFIFNSLNSIKHHIQFNEKRKANEFLTGFAYLIRQTLDISGKSKITLSEEIQYLRSYLSMERLKGDVQLAYEIRVGNNLQSDVFEMPPLILQPFLENSIRRSIDCSEKPVLNLTIQFTREEDLMLCRILDNVACKIEEVNMQANSKEYPLKGIELAKKRIDLLNELGHEKILIHTDSILQGAVVKGTEVMIKIPMFLYAQQD